MPFNERGIDEAQSHRTDGCFRASVNTNLHVEVCQMIPRRLGRDAEPAGDLLVGRTLGHELQDFALAGSEFVDAMLSQCVRQSIRIARPSGSAARPMTSADPTGSIHTYMESGEVILRLGFNSAN
jgi:hypothetical protein